MSDPNFRFWVSIDPILGAQMVRNAEVSAETNSKLGWKEYTELMYLEISSRWGIRFTLNFDKLWSSFSLLVKNILVIDVSNQGS